MSLADIRRVTTKVVKDYEHSLVTANTNTLIHKISFDSPQMTNLFSGFSYDRIHQLFGPESSGKSSISAYIAGQLQAKMPAEIKRYSEELTKEGLTYRGMDGKTLADKLADKQVVLYLDYERTFDSDYATRLGMQCDEEHLILLQPDTIEDGAKMAMDYLKTGSICLVVLDSDAMASTNLDLESDPGDTGFGGAKGANVLKQVYKNMARECSNYLTPMIVISQERANMNMMSHLPSVTGGTAIRFAATTRQRISKLENIKIGNEDVGIQIRVRNYKNKGGTPWRDAIMNLYFDNGFDSNDEYFDFIVLFGFINKGNGGVYSADFLPNGKIRGADNLKAWLTDDANKEIYESLKQKVTQKLLTKNELDNNNVAVADENGIADSSDDDNTSALAAAALGVESEDNGDTPTIE